MATTHPYPGMAHHKNKFGMDVAYLHCLADPSKPVEWVQSEVDRSPDRALAKQELNIEFDARAGELVFQLTDGATLEKSFPIPAHWTRYFAIDPHRGIPDAALWVAIDPHGEAWAYRELWPSKIYGEPGNVPADDNRVSIKHMVETIKWLELGMESTMLNSAGEEMHGNPKNKYGDDRIFRRMIDYAARSFGLDKDDPKALNFQERYQKYMLEMGVEQPFFEDCKKDWDVGVEIVNEWLKPRSVETGTGEWVEKSRLHIFEDECPELVYELRNNRVEQLTPLQADRMDPTWKPLPKRKHQTDNLRYLLTANPVYHQHKPLRSDFKPLHEGVNY